MLKALIVGGSLVLGTAGLWFAPQMHSRMVMGVLHTFGATEVVTAANLNNNFTWLNTNKIGAGVQLSNSDVATGAAIGPLFLQVEDTSGWQENLRRKMERGEKAKEEEEREV